MQDHSTVEYRDVPGFPGYRVGSDGTVWSCKVIGSKYGRTGKWRQLKSAKTNPSGHQFVSLCRSDGIHAMLVHRLVLLSFIGPCPSGMECCHGDGNPHNNALWNLRWGTSKDNSADTLAHGTRNRGSRHGMAKVSEDIVQDIRREYATGKTTQRTLARKHGISVAAICLIIQNKTWRHV